MPDTFSSVPAAGRAASSGRRQPATLSISAACLLGLALLAGSASASVIDTADCCPNNAHEAQKALSENDFDRFKDLLHATRKCHGALSATQADRR